MSIMKLLAAVLVFIACTVPALGQVNLPLASVRRDFREASVVVRMNITDTKRIGTSDGYLYQFIASGEVTSSFKGGFKKGQRLEYYTHAEEGIDHNHRRGDYIAFLVGFDNRGSAALKELPDGNSVHPYSQEVLAQVRTVWREQQRRRKTRD
jgi:hypothetical protein